MSVTTQPLHAFCFSRATYTECIVISQFGQFQEAVPPRLLYLVTQYIYCNLKPPFKILAAPMNILYTQFFRYCHIYVVGIILPFLVKLLFLDFLQVNNAN